MSQVAWWFENPTNIPRAIYTTIHQTVYLSITDLGNFIMKVTTRLIGSNKNIMTMSNSENGNLMGFSVGSIFLMTCFIILLTSPLMSHAFRVQMPQIIRIPSSLRRKKNVNGKSILKRGVAEDNNTVVSSTIEQDQYHGDINHDGDDGCDDSVNPSADTNSQSSMSQSKTIHSSLHSSFKHVLHEVSSMFEESQNQVRKALEDFSQPFLGFTRGDDDISDDDATSYYDDKGSSNNNDNDNLETIVIQGFLENQNQMEEKEESTTVEHNGDMTHFCFLVHGYRGKPADLLYLRSAMADTAEKTFSSSLSSSISSSINLVDENTSKNAGTTHTTATTHNATAQFDKDQTKNINSSIQTPSRKSNKHRIILHSCQSNWHRTSDGIEAGGERIFDEMLAVIQKSMQQEQSVKNDIDRDNDIHDVTVSLIGNSLGGLYSRYAIARLAAYAKNQTLNSTDVGTTMEDPSDSNDGNINNKSFLIDGKIRIHFNIFCTTATPHLGVSGHTWLPIPRSAEVGIGSLMGQTGRDIFRTSSLLKTMCTDDFYLKPLGSFCKRIAYANGYHTDFVVSTKTAAFLHPESTIPHTMSDRHLNNQEKVEDSDNNGKEARDNHTDNKDNGMVVATLYTKASEDSSSYSKVTSTDEKSNQKEESRKLLPKLLVSSNMIMYILYFAYLLYFIQRKKRCAQMMFYPTILCFIREVIQ